MSRNMSVNRRTQRSELLNAGTLRPFAGSMPRGALLSGTALTAGLLMGASGMVLMPTHALAACNDITLGLRWFCDSATAGTQTSFVTGVDGWLAGLNNDPVPFVLTGGGVTINNNGDYSGLFYAGDKTKITSDTQ